MEELFKYQINNFITIYHEDNTDIEGRYFRNLAMTSVIDDLGEVNFLFDTKPYKPKVLEFTRKGFSDYESDFLKNFGNPLASVTKRYLMIVIEKDEHKLSLKIFDGTKMRGVGKTFFRRRKNLLYLTLNKKTGDIYSGNLSNYNLSTKKRSSITKNFFFSNNTHRLVNKVKSFTSNNQEAIDAILKAFDIFSKEISNKPEDHFKSLSDKLLEFYLKKKGIKYPNNFKVFFEKYEYRLNLKLIRKNGNKLVDAFMKKNNLKGNSVKKVLHEIEFLNLPILSMAFFMFPNDWVYQDEELIKDCLHFGRTGLSTNYFYFNELGENIDELNMTNSEKRCMFEIFRNTVLKNKLELFTFLDHIRFYRELKLLGEQVKWTCKNKESFNNEHLKFTEQLDYYKKGHYFRTYPKFMYDNLEKQIVIGDEIYFPVLLNDTQSYNQESLIQSNCVKNYVGSASSIIISLRKGNKESEERATIEFKINSKVDNKISFTVPQSLGRFNGKLSENWNEPIDILKKTFYKCIRDSKFETVKLKKIFMNGKELSSNSTWDDNGILRWESVDITKYY